MQPESREIGAGEERVTLVLVVLVFFELLLTITLGCDSHREAASAVNSRW
jgi:hypothetical protein